MLYFIFWNFHISLASRLTTNPLSSYGHNFVSFCVSISKAYPYDFIMAWRESARLRSWFVGPGFCAPTFRSYICTYNTTFVQYLLTIHRVFSSVASLSLLFASLLRFHLIYNANLNESADVHGRDACDTAMRCAKFSLFLNEKRMAILHTMVEINLVKIIVRKWKRIYAIKWKICH